jgi:DNA (cytosine-5)-methyltransferase 1
MNIFKYIDLCCGIGGFHQAIDNLNINSEILLAADIDNNCRKTYFKNYNIEPEKDLKDIDLEKLESFDGIFAGFPCQSFSVSGKRLGLDDARGTVIYNILNIIKIKKPSLVCLENVKGLKSTKNKDKDGNEVRAYNLIYSELEKYGYNITDRIISPHQINIPQFRERVIIIGILKDKLESTFLDSNIFKVKFDEILNDNIKDYKEKNKNYNIFNEKDLISNDSFLNKEEKLCLEIWNDFITMKEWDSINNEILQQHMFNITGKKQRKNYKQANFFFDFLHYKDSQIIPEHLINSKRKKKVIPMGYKKTSDEWNLLYREPSIKKLIDKFLNKWNNIINNLNLNFKYLEYAGNCDYGSKNSINNFYIQLRMSGFRVRKNKLFPTLVKSGPLPIIPSKHRYLTIKECARLQSFKENFYFINKSTAIKQLGNAVNVQVIEVMLKTGLYFLHF